MSASSAFDETIRMLVEFAVAYVRAHHPDYARFEKRRGHLLRVSFVAMHDPLPLEDVGMDAIHEVRAPIGNDFVNIAQALGTWHLPDHAYYSRHIGAWSSQNEGTGDTTLDKIHRAFVKAFGGASVCMEIWRAREDARAKYTRPLIDLYPPAAEDVSVAIGAADVLNLSVSPCYTNRI